jgi:hypothetical protein
MKQVLVAFILALTMGSAALADAPKETTKVCVDVKDKEGKVVTDKAGKPKQNCKEMKVHKKLEGTVVPEKK